MLPVGYAALTVDQPNEAIIPNCVRLVIILIPRMAGRAFLEIYHMYRYLLYLHTWLNYFTTPAKDSSIDVNSQAYIHNVFIDFNACQFISE